MRYALSGSGVKATYKEMLGIFAPTAENGKIALHLDHSIISIILSETVFKIPRVAITTTKSS